MANAYPENPQKLSIAEKIKNLNIPVEQQEQPIDLYIHNKLHCSEERKIKRFEQIQCRWCEYPMSNQRKKMITQAALKVKRLIFNQELFNKNNKEEEQAPDQPTQCIICLSDEAKPVYECINGHEVCYYCAKKIPLCPFCRGEMARFANYENVIGIINNWSKDEKYKNTHYQSDKVHERIDFFFKIITNELGHFDRSTWNNRISSTPNPSNNPFLPDIGNNDEFSPPDIGDIRTPTPLTPNRVEIMDEEDEIDLPNPWGHTV